MIRGLWAASAALVLSLLAAASAAAQDVSFRIFAQGQPIGTETVTVTVSDVAWTVRSTGQIAAPVSLTTRVAEMIYDREWRPQALYVDGVIKDKVTTIKTTFSGTSAASDVVQDDRNFQKTDTVDERTIVMPNLIFGMYEALAARVSKADPGATFRVYAAPAAELTVRLTHVSTERVSAPGRAFESRRHALVFEQEGKPLAVDLWTDGERLMRISVPSAGLEVIRDDVATVATRQSANYRKNDLDVKIPTPTAFYLAGTLSKPAGAPDATAATTRLPAIVLVPGPGTSDRDENIGGVPVFAQLAGGLADAGFAVVRYDRRGIGQSGGRSESAGIGDAADDAGAVVKFLEKRKDIDKERIVLVGHGEGAAAALLAVRRTGRVKAAVLVAGPGTTGADLVLERQQRAFEAAKIAESDRAAKVELQKKVNTAVLTGKGWNDVPEEMRRRAESPGFASLLAYDPASLVSKIDQPLLILHGGADAEFPPHHAEKLGALANARKRAPKTEVIVLPGVNHQLVSGEARTVAPEIVSKIAEWVKALPASD